MSISHLVILLLILLLIFGPSRLEGIGSSLGKGIKGFKKGLEDDDAKTVTKTKIEKTEDKV